MLAKSFAAFSQSLLFLTGKRFSLDAWVSLIWKGPKWTTWTLQQNEHAKDAALLILHPAMEEAEPQRKFFSAENSTQTCWFTLAYGKNNMGWRLRNVEMLCSKEVDPGSLLGLAAGLLTEHQSYLLEDEGLNSQLSVILRPSHGHEARWNLLQGT